MAVAMDFTEKTVRKNTVFCGRIITVREEAGITAARYDFLGEFYPSPGYCGEILYLYSL